MSQPYPLNSLPPNGYVLPPGYSQVTLFNPSQNYTRSTENLLAVASMIPQTLVNLNNSNMTTSVNSTFTTSSGYYSSQLANSSAQNVISNQVLNENLSSHNISLRNGDASMINERSPPTNHIQCETETSHYSNTSPTLSPSVREENTVPTSNTETPKQFTFINTVLAFMKSEAARKDQHAVIENVITNFTLEELLDCRKQLFLASGCKKYQYRPPNDPATTHEKAKHCVRSIISKCEDLVRAGIDVKIVCDADELYRLSQLLTKNDESELKNEQYEKRLSVLEMKVNIIEKKCVSPISNTVEPVDSDFPPLSSGNRQQLLSEIISKQAKSATPVGSKRQRTNERSNENWTRVDGRNKNNHRPAYWGRNDDDSASTTLRGAEKHEVFLFNYLHSATEEAIKNHFTSKGIQVINVTQKSHPDSDTKSFMMKISQREEFDKVIKFLPPKTGARWFIPPRQYQQRFRSDSVYNRRPFIAGTPSSANVTPARRALKPSVRGSRSDRDDILDTPNSTNTLRSSRQPAANGITPITDSNQQSSNTSIVPNFRIGEPVSLQRINQDNAEGQIIIDSNSNGPIDDNTSNVLQNNVTVSDLNSAHSNSNHNG